MNEKQKKVAFSIAVYEQLASGNPHDGDWHEMRNELMEVGPEPNLDEVTQFIEDNTKQIERCALNFWDWAKSNFAG